MTKYGEVDVFQQILHLFDVAPPSEGPIPVKAAGPLAQSCLIGLSCSYKEYMNILHSVVNAQTMSPF